MVHSLEIIQRSTFSNKYGFRASCIIIRQIKVPIQDWWPGFMGCLFSINDGKHQKQDTTKVGPHSYLLMALFSLWSHHRYQLKFLDKDEVVKRKYRELLEGWCSIIRISPPNHYTDQNGFSLFDSYSLLQAYRITLKLTLAVWGVAGCLPWNSIFIFSIWVNFCCHKGMSENSKLLVGRVNYRSKDATIFLLSLVFPQVLLFTPKLFKHNINTVQADWFNPGKRHFPS